jgi:hypothetical protein
VGKVGTLRKIIIKQYDKAIFLSDFWHFGGNSSGNTHANHTKQVGYVPTAVPTRCSKNSG